mgnify:CR=1 FL=1
MTDYLVYWKIGNVREALRTQNWSHACWGSGRGDFETKFAAGDRIYFNTIDEEGHHYVFSKMVLDRYSGSKEDTDKMVPFSLYQVPFNSYWMGGEPWVVPCLIPFGSLARTLDFKSGRVLPPGYNGQHLQAIRELTQTDSLAIEQLISSFSGRESV